MRKSFGLMGKENVIITGLDTIQLFQKVQCHITMEDISLKHIMLKFWIDTAIKIEYIEHGDILHYLLQNLAKVSWTLRVTKAQSGQVDLSHIRPKQIDQSVSLIQSLTQRHQS